MQAGGFSLHAGIDIDPGQRQKLERLCRYVSRPPVAVDRMALTASGQVRHGLKTPLRTGLPAGPAQPRLSLPLGRRVQLAVLGRDVLVGW